MPEHPSPAFEVESIENHNFRFHLLHQQSIFIGSFLDAQASLAPTHVSLSVGWLVGWSHFRISNLWSPYVTS